MAGHLETYGWDTSYFPRLAYFPASAPGSDGDYLVRKTGNVYTWATVAATGPRQVDLVEEFSSSNYYESQSGWRGASNFLACVCFSHWDSTTAIQTLCGNLDPSNADGWSFVIAAGTSPGHVGVAFNACDGSNNIRSQTALLTNPYSAGGGGALTHNRLIVLHAVVWQTGGNMDVRLYANGGLVGVSTGIASGYSTSGDSFMVGRSPGASPLQLDTGDVQGIGLKAATFNTDFDEKDIRDHYDAIVTAGGMTDFDASAFSAYVTADGMDGTTPSTWANQGTTTTTDDLTKNGSPTTRQVPEKW